jgi:hypothetical protein
MIQCSQYSNFYCYIFSQGICSRINPEKNSFVTIINGECIPGPILLYDGFTKSDYIAPYYYSSCNTDNIGICLEEDTGVF